MPAARGAAEPGGRFSRVVLPLALGLLLLTLALPRLVAAIAELPARPVLEALRLGQPQSLPRLQAAAGALGAALEHGDEARLWNGLAVLRQQQALLAGLGEGPGAALLQDAATAAARALVLAPGDGYAWARLAEAQLRLRGPGEAVAAFARALALSPNDLGRLWQQLDLGLALWPSLPAEQRLALPGLLREAARRNPHQLSWLAARRHALGPVREALAADAELLARFDAAYRSRRL